MIKYWETNIKNHPIGIRKTIKEIMHNYQYSLYPITSIFKAIKNVVNIKQDDKEYLEAFTKRFNNYKDIMETQHGNLTLSKYIKTLPGYDSSKIEKVKLDSE